MKNCHLIAAFLATIGIYHTPLLNGMETKKEISTIVKKICTNVRARARLKREQERHQAQVKNQFLESSEKDQIKSAVAEIFERFQKNRGFGCCPICQEPLGKNPYITLHKSTKSNIPHQFCTHCLYTWCKKTDPKKFDKEPPEILICIPCPLCHECDETQEKDENGDYPLKKFDLNLTELEDGSYAYNKKQLSLAERLANLEGLSPRLVIDTLSEYCILTEKERETVVEDRKGMAKRLQRYMTDAYDVVFVNETGKIIPSLDIYKDLLAELILNIIEANHPLTQDFIGTIFNVLPPEKQLFYFRHALNGCSSISDKEIIDRKDELPEFFYITQYPSDSQNQAIKKESISAEQLIKNVRYFERCIFCGLCLPQLPVDIQKEEFKKILHSEAPTPVIKSKGLGHVFPWIAPEVAVTYFNDVYPSLSPAKQLKALIRLRSLLVQKDSVEAILQLLDECKTVSQEALESYWSLMSTERRLTYFSRFLSSCVSLLDDDRIDTVSACIESICKKIDLEDRTAYFEKITSFINAYNNRPAFQYACCKKIFTRLSMHQNTDTLYHLYKHLQQNMETSDLDLMHKRLLIKILPLITDEATKILLTAATMDALSHEYERDDIFLSAWGNLSPTLRISFFENYFIHQKHHERMFFLKKFRSQLPSETWQICLASTVAEDLPLQLITKNWSSFPPYTHARTFDSFFAPFYPLPMNKNIPLIKKLQQTLPLKLYGKLTQTTEQSKKLTVLAAEWKNIPLKQRRDGLIFALLQIAGSYTEIFAATKPSEWLDTCTLDEKIDLLDLLWHTRPYNRLASYFTVFKCCNRDEKKALLKLYAVKLGLVKKQHILAPDNIALTRKNRHQHDSPFHFHEW